MDAMYIGHSAARDDSCSESNRAIAVFVCMGFFFSTCARSLAAQRSMAFMAGRFGERACLLFILQANRDDPTIIYSYMCCRGVIFMGTAQGCVGVESEMNANRRRSTRRACMGAIYMATTTSMHGLRVGVPSSICFRPRRPCSKQHGIRWDSTASCMVIDRAS